MWVLFLLVTESSTRGSKDPECACFGELGLNNEAKASRFEPNLSLSNKKRDQMYGLFLFLSSIEWETKHIRKATRSVRSDFNLKRVVRRNCRII